MRRHGRNDKLRTLNRFDVQRVLDDKWNPVAYVVKPRGFSTVLFRIDRPETTAKSDFGDFMEAVLSVCDIPAPK